MYCDSAFQNKDLVNDMIAEGQPFVIAGAGKRLPLVTALAGSHLPRDSHLLLEDHAGLLYSYTLMTKDEMSAASVAALKVKVAVINAFYTSNRSACRCVSLEIHNAANDLDKVSDDTLHIICKKLGIPEGNCPSFVKNASASTRSISTGRTVETRAPTIAKLVGAEPGAVIESQCKSCLQRSNVAIMSDPEVAEARKEALASLKHLTVPQLKKKCNELHLKKKGNKAELQERIADAMVVPESVVDGWAEGVSALFADISPGHSPVSIRYLTRFNMVDQFDRDFYSQGPCAWRGSVFGKVHF